MLNQIVLPAIRGVMGDWIYYSCLMDLGELSERVCFAAEVHKNQALSDMIQRRLIRSRSAQIAEYLRSQSERFFNSLVVATYGGQPNWHALSNVRDMAERDELQHLSEETIASVGFLTLRGDENLFALDGQHRLAGIKKAVKDGLDQDPYDDVPVIFVAHQATEQGLERTRRLFTTLNKTAKPVSKGDIIALDEDDVMAICARRLIEDTDLFTTDRVALVANNNLPAKNFTALTTIGNLYDVLTILFTNSQFELRRRKPDLLRLRPDDDDLDKYFSFSKDYFDRLREYFPALDDFFSAQETKPVVTANRGDHGGHVMFRPIGFEILTRIVARLTHDMPLADAVHLAAKLPHNLADEPYEGLMWDSSNRIMLNSHKVTLREVLLYMIDKNGKGFPESKLLERYRRETGKETSELPARVV